MQRHLQLSLAGVRVGDANAGFVLVAQDLVVEGDQDGADEATEDIARRHGRQRRQVGLPGVGPDVRLDAAQEAVTTVLVVQPVLEVVEGGFLGRRELGQGACLQQEVA